MSKGICVDVYVNETIQNNRYKWNIDLNIDSIENFDNELSKHTLDNWTYSGYVKFFEMQTLKMIYDTNNEIG